MIKLNRYIFLVVVLLLAACHSKSEKEEKGGSVTQKDSVIMKEKDTTPETDLEKAKQIHDRIISIDTHVDIDVGNFIAHNNYTDPINTKVTLEKMREGGLDAVFLIVYTAQGPLTDEGYKKAYANADAKFKAIHRLVEELGSDDFEIATTAADVRRIHKKGKLAILIGVENGYPIDHNLSKIEEFYNRGARYFSMTHNGHNQLADSNTGEPDYGKAHGGLTELGKEAIAELNRLGIMIDLSHPAQSTNRQTIELSKAPVIASHSSARALNDVPRNLWDKELKAIAKTGGVVQVVAVAKFLNKKKKAAYEAKMKELVNVYAKREGKPEIPWDNLKELDQDTIHKYMSEYVSVLGENRKQINKKLERTAPPVGVCDLVDHIDYMVDLIGIDHVGIASDFDGGGGIEGWNDASETFNVTLELVKRGYTEGDIEKLWGENLLRVMDEVQQVAQKIQAEEG